MKKALFSAIVFLAIFAPCLVGAQGYLYYVPYVTDSDVTGTGVGIRNLSGDAAANVTYTVYKRDGDVAALAESPDHVVAPNGQTAFLIQTQSATEGSLVVESDQPLAGLCFIMNVEGLNYLSDIPFSSTRSTIQVVPHSAQSNSWDTSFYVQNANATAADVTVSYFDADGAMQHTQTHSLAANGSGVFPLADLAEGNAYSNGSVVITSPNPICAFALYDNLKTGQYSNAGINAIDPGTDGAWVLYDDFESGQFDPAKWILDQSSAVITTENGRAKFVHMNGFANDSSWLEFANPTGIRSVKADFEVQDCTGDVMARLGGTDLVDQQGNFIYQVVQLRNDRGYIDFFVGAYDSNSDAQQYEMHYSHFKNPVPISGQKYTATLGFSPEKIVGEVEGLGAVNLSPHEKLSPAAEHLRFRGIGTRSLTGDGPCTVYIDNVFVQQVGPPMQPPQ